jgi:hypothetical protein
LVLHLNRPLSSLSFAFIFVIGTRDAQKENCDHILIEKKKPGT